MLALADMLPDLDQLPELSVAGLSDDSRVICAGDAFVAVRGELSDGHDHAAAAVGRGAVVVLAEKMLAGLSVPVVVVPNLKERRSEIAGRAMNDPSARLHCVGVTGTNGKTSIAYYLAELASALGHRTGYLGTIGWGFPDSLKSAQLTTDSAINTQKRLYDLERAGAQWVTMEVSSHALDQNRVAAIQFDVAVFTNLSRDHLDYHETFEAYGATKAKLFEMAPVAIINIDDDFGAHLAQSTSAGKVISYGRSGDIRWEKLRFHDRGVSGVWHTPWGSSDFTLPLVGEFAVANLSAVLGVLCLSGVPVRSVVELAQEVKPVPGRVEFFPGKPNIVVDYAHTPDALEKVLATLRPHVEGRLICVIGCGGDRDPGKRPLMASTAESGADIVWLTSDNPRSEDPQAIIRDMVTGLRGRGDIRQCSDRRAAITEAFSEARSNDLLLIAGKGHEDYQEIAGRRLAFSDRQLARELRSSSTGSDGLSGEAL